MSKDEIAVLEKSKDQRFEDLEEIIMRYIKSCCYRWLSGGVKAEMHRELCNYYVGSKRNLKVEKLWDDVHEETQNLTSYLDTVIGLDVTTRNPRLWVSDFFDRFDELAVSIINRTQLLEK